MSLMYKLFNVPRTPGEIIDRAKQTKRKVSLEVSFECFPNTGDDAFAFAQGLDTYQGLVVMHVEGEKNAYRQSFSLRTFIPGYDSEEMKKLESLRNKTIGQARELYNAIKQSGIEVALSEEGRKLFGVN